MENVTHRLPGLVLADRTFTVPLDHAQPRAAQIQVFAREVVAPGKERADLPWLVFFQGGPGFGSPRPRDKGGWLKRALQDYRVLLLDERGTGRSTPVTVQDLVRMESPEAQARYLMHFRADAIVRDAELIRQELLGEQGKWTALGQSFGGFCVTHYLSAAPQGLQAAIITGGLPPVERPVDDVYRATYRRVIEKNKRYYKRYPEDIQRAHEILHYLENHDVRLPAGGHLTTRRFQQLGISFGASDGFEAVHYLLEDAFAAGAAGRELSFSFLRGFENSFSFETNPIYALLHEAEYCQRAASNWSAERLRAEYPEFDRSPTRPLMFTGEMVYPWMWEDYEHLRPLQETAEILATYDGWPPLYDVTRLHNNQVPAVAAVYYNDMYVDRELSEATARQIRGIRLWVTNEYEHNALRADGERLLDRLLAMLNGEA